MPGQLDAYQPWPYRLYDRFFEILRDSAVYLAHNLWELLLRVQRSFRGLGLGAIRDDVEAQKTLEYLGQAPQNDNPPGMDKQSYPSARYSGSSLIRTA